MYNLLMLNKRLSNIYLVLISLWEHDVLNHSIQSNISDLFWLLALDR